MRTVYCWIAGAALAPALPSCAFFPGGDEAGLDQCETDADCDEHRACNPISKMCELQAPKPEAFMLKGPFEVIPEAPLWGGAALSAAWDDFSSNDYQLPAMDAFLTHQSHGSDVTSGDRWAMAFSGPRHFIPEFGTVAFFKAFVELRKDDIREGRQSVSPAAGSLLYCVAEAVPEDGSLDGTNPWQSDSNEANLTCWQFFAIGEGTITFDKVDLEEGGEGMVSGYMELDLIEAVFPPE